MNRRNKLQGILEEIASPNKVYYQPPENLRMIFPCIEYHLAGITQIYADDETYHAERRYQVTVIDAKPENPWILKLLQLPKCSFGRHYTSDGLNHDVFYIYY